LDPQTQEAETGLKNDRVSCGESGLYQDRGHDVWQNRSAQQVNVVGADCARGFDHGERAWSKEGDHAHGQQHRWHGEQGVHHAHDQDIDESGEVARPQAQGNAARHRQKGRRQAHAK
jgi:hypothetical protein